MAEFETEPAFPNMDYLAHPIERTTTSFWSSPWFSFSIIKTISIIIARIGVYKAKL